MGFIVMWYYFLNRKWRNLIYVFRDYFSYCGKVDYSLDSFILVVKKSIDFVIVIFIINKVDNLNFKFVNIFYKIKVFFLIWGIIRLFKGFDLFLIDFYL